eukprot:8540319-Pyramimonas_sp.AAC.1
MSLDVSGKFPIQSKVACWRLQRDSCTEQLGQPSFQMLFFSYDCVCWCLACPPRLLEGAWGVPGSVGFDWRLHETHFPARKLD